MNRLKPMRISLLTAAVLLSAVSVRGAEYKIPGQYRFRLDSVSSFLINNAPEKSRQTFLLENRLRLSPELKLGENLRVRAEGDFRGNAGDENGFPSAYADWARDPGAQLDFRQAYLEWKTRFGILRAGQMASSVGMGILANGGEDREDPENELQPVAFGDAYYGDLADRLLFATKPFSAFSRSWLAEHLVTVLAFDLIYRDENADLLDGDRALQGVFLSFLEEKGFRAEIYAAYRNQKDDDGDELKVWALDFSGQMERELEKLRAWLKFEGEIAFTLGETSQLRNHAHPDGVSVRGLGGALRGLLWLPYLSSTTGLEMGGASGDSNLEDGTAYIFKFDPNYRAGLILFEEVLAEISAAGAARAANPNLVGVPSPGVELLPSNGSISNAYYLFLTQSLKPVPRLTTALGLLYARSAGDLLDPYLTLQAGENRNFLDRPARDKSLGWELDGQVSYQIRPASRFRPEVGMEAGVFFPGRALADADGKTLDPIYKVRGRITVNW
ncbi:MAG: hypothetical protein NT009_02885 [Proteobacteria bacterium]|nr:hypothetical protein [Pseudomonadota bacterium]